MSEKELDEVITYITKYDYNVILSGNKELVDELQNHIKNEDIYILYNNMFKDDNTIYFLNNERLRNKEIRFRW